MQFKNFKRLICRVLLTIFYLCLLISCQHSTTSDSELRSHFSYQNGDPKSDLLSKLNSELAKQDSIAYRRKTAKFTGIDSVLILKDNKILFEEYYNRSNKTQAHPLTSAGKSILSGLVGIAVDKADLTLTKPVYRYFNYPEYQYWSDKKASLSLHHLLSMTAGWQCDDSNYDQAYCVASMKKQQDPYKWLLDRPMAALPGERFNYNDAIPHLVSLLLARTSQSGLSQFAEKNLFKPLSFKNNLFSGEGLTSREMLKFGLLYLNQGKWQGKQIIPQQWVELSQKPHYQFKSNEFADSYGYFWWNKTFEANGKKYPSFFASGNGGQYIIIFPRHNTVVVFTGSHYNQNRKMNQPFTLLKKYILPVIG